MSTELADKAPTSSPHRFSVDNYHRMLEVGILTEDDRVELIEGEVVEMSPIGKRHAGVVNRLVALLYGSLNGRVVVSAQNPVTLSDDAEPQPDVALLRFREDYYTQDLPTPTDVLLIVEVADTSVAADRAVKVPLYARAGIPEVWLVNLNQDAVEVYSAADNGAYQTVRRVSRGQALPIPGFPGVELNVEDILG